MENNKVKKCITKVIGESDLQPIVPEGTVVGEPVIRAKNPFNQLVPAEMFYQDIPFWKEVSYLKDIIAYQNCVKNNGANNCTEPDPNNYGANGWHEVGPVPVMQTFTLDPSAPYPEFDNPVKPKKKVMPMYTSTRINPSGCPYKGTLTEADVPKPTVPDGITGTRYVSSNSFESSYMPVVVDLSPASWDDSVPPIGGDIKYTLVPDATKKFRFEIVGQGKEITEYLRSEVCDEHYCA